MWGADFRRVEERTARLAAGRMGFILFILTPVYYGFNPVSLIRKVSRIRNR